RHRARPLADAQLRRAASRADRREVDARARIDVHHGAARRLRSGGADAARRVCIIRAAMSNRTFTIVKPDSVRKGNFGKIISRLESEGFRILGLKKVGLSKAQAQGFYAVHSERPFFSSLVDYMTSGPVFVAALERENAVRHLRDVMGATDPV